MELTALSYLDLAIQIIILGALLVDYLILRRKSLKQHIALLTAAFIANTVLIVAVMIVPFLGESVEILENLLEAESLLFLSHHIIGLIAELLGGFLVLRWVAKRFDTSSCKEMRLMRLAMGTWIISILLGIVLFAWHLIE
jgi:uncharacterized membrane protein YozB (DUF420 family)